MTEYSRPDHRALGEYYTRHISAMTKEGLVDKAEIAAELAVRDKEIDALKHFIRQGLDQHD